MKEFIEKTLHQDILLVPYAETGNFPLVLRNGYNLFAVTIGSSEFLLAEPINRTNLAILRKEQQQIESITNTRCALFLHSMNHYTRDTMVKEGIPFVWEDHQVFLPFLGIILDAGRKTIIVAKEKISFLTQKLLLTALYHNWNGMTVSNAALKLEVTKTSVSRCFDEIEALSLPFLSLRSRARKLSIGTDRRGYWNTITPYLRSPVITSYQLRQPIEGEQMLAGLTALSYYSMLDDNQPKTVAVTKKDIASLSLSYDMLTPAGESPVCVVHEVGYRIEFGTGVAEDPLSVVLSLNDEEKEDPRISLAVDEMLEAHVW